jgi:hypothetical protein
MADLVLDTEAAPNSPAASAMTWFVDSTTKLLSTKDSTGFIRSYGTNFSTTSQSPTATTRTYVNGTNFQNPAGRIQIGTQYRFTIELSKTGAGSATSTYDVAFGTAGTTADTARISFTKPAGTAVIDAGKIVITVIIRGPIGASCIAAGEFTLTHNLASTGHATTNAVNIQANSAAFDITSVTNVGVCETTGTGDVITHNVVQSEVWNI